MNSEKRMIVRPFLLPLALALFAARCSDQMGAPPTAPPSLTQAPHFLRWARASQPQFSVSGAISSPVGNSGIRADLSGGGLSLAQYTASFWAVRGEQRSVQINYLSSTGDTSFPFLHLTITDPVYMPGLGDIMPGDSVQITVTVDPTDIKVTLEPTGLQFGEPAQLQISYGGAGGDMNGDGVVDEGDAQIETSLLGLWYREGADSAWAQIPASQSIGDKSFISALRHFCEYEVSYFEYAVSW